MFVIDEEWMQPPTARGECGGGSGCENDSAAVKCAQWYEIWIFFETKKINWYF